MTTTTRSDRSPANAKGPSHAESARTIVAASGTASLATICTAPAGYPFVSVTLYALDANGNPILALSDLAEHAQNLKHDARASLMALEQTETGPMASGRVTLVGTCAPLGDGERDTVRALYLAAHPDAVYVDFADFKLYRLTVETVRYVGGFGRMSWVKGDDFRGAEPDPIAPHATGILQHCNDDHPDTLVLYCRAFAGLDDTTGAVMTAVDRHGFDLRAQTPEGPKPVRISYDVQCVTPDEVRVEMVRIARLAREQLGL